MSIKFNEIFIIEMCSREVHVVRVNARKPWRANESSEILRGSAILARRTEILLQTGWRSWAQRPRKSWRVLRRNYIPKLISVSLIIQRTMS